MLNGTYFLRKTDWSNAGHMNSFGIFDISRAVFVPFFPLRSLVQTYIVVRLYRLNYLNLSAL